MRRESLRVTKGKLTQAQLSALLHPLGHTGDFSDAWSRELRPRGCVATVTCDVDPESMEYFGGPVWHACVCPPSRAHAEALLSGVGEGVLFENQGDDANFYHLRRRMTPREITDLGDVVATTVKGGMR